MRLQCFCHQRTYVMDAFVSPTQLCSFESQTSPLLHCAVAPEISMMRIALVSSSSPMMPGICMCVVSRRFFRNPFWMGFQTKCNLLMPKILEEDLQFELWTNHLIFKEFMEDRHPATQPGSLRHSIFVNGQCQTSANVLLRHQNTCYQ